MQRVFREKIPEKSRGRWGRARLWGGGQEPERVCWGQVTRLLLCNPFQSLGDGVVPALALPLVAAPGHTTPGRAAIARPVASPGV